MTFVVGDPPGLEAIVATGITNSLTDPPLARDGSCSAGFAVSILLTWDYFNLLASCAGSIFTLMVGEVSGHLSGLNAALRGELTAAPIADSGWRAIIVEEARFTG